LWLCAISNPIIALSYMHGSENLTTLIERSPPVPSSLYLK
jgi:hypothetical protein